MSTDEIAALRGLGPVCARWLAGIGITTAAELRRVGAVEAFGRITAREGGRPNRNLLYALYAALEDKHWTAVTADEKARLLQAAGLDATPRRPRPRGTT